MSKLSAKDLAKIGLGEKDTSDLRSEVNNEMRKRFMQYKPYAKQKLFHNSQGLERIMSGGNQSGKTFAGAMECAIHATGLYPDWWEGHRLQPRHNPSSDEYELNIWVLGTDNKTVRDSLMAKIIGTVNKDFNNGLIHQDYILKTQRMMVNGTTGLVDNIKIRHSSGVESTLYFRSYEQGRSNLQSATVSIMYLDEEPPDLVMGELKARLTATNGLMFMAFTPLNGMTSLVQSFWKSTDPDMFLVCMSIEESGHMDAAALRAVKKRYSSLSSSERKARLHGEPSMGSGAIFPFEDKDLSGFIPDPVPDHWQYLNAMDFGRGETPTAVVFGVYDPFRRVAYIYDAEVTTGKTVAQNASLIKRRGKWIPTAFPHDLLKDTGVGSSKKVYGTISEGTTYRDHYAAEGVNMTTEFARTDKKSALVEVGLTIVREMMDEGRLKVSPALQKWFDEKNIYRYGEDNKPIKKNDHLMDATRYLLIMLRYAISRLDINETSNGEMTDDTDIYA